MMNFGLPEVLMLIAVAFIPLLIGAVLVAIPAWRLVQRTGLHAPLGLLAVVPLIRIALLWYLAFAKWPAVEQAEKPWNEPRG